MVSRELNLNVSAVCREAEVTFSVSPSKGKEWLNRTPSGDASGGCQAPWDAPPGTAQLQQAYTEEGWVGRDIVGAVRWGLC